MTPMDVIDLLTNDHAEVNALFGRFKQASKPETKQELATQIVHELSVHAAVEEQFVYPLMRAKLENGSEKAKGLVPTHPHPLVPGTATAQLVTGPWASIVDHVRDLVSR